MSGWLYLPSLPLFLAGPSQGWLVPLALGGTLLFGAIGLYVGVVLATLFRAPSFSCSCATIEMCWGRG